MMPREDRFLIAQAASLGMACWILVGHWGTRAIVATILIGLSYIFYDEAYRGDDG